MPSHRPVQVRVDPATRDRWQVEADRRGIALSEFIRSCVDGVLDGSWGGVKAAPRGSTTGATASVIVHCRNAQRHKKGVRCGYCGVVG